MSEQTAQSPRTAIVHLFPSRIRARLGKNVRTILLFGSEARNEARDDSDVDYFILLDNAASVQEAHEIIDEEAGRILVEQGQVISAFATREGDFVQHASNPLFINIRREGIAI